MKDEPGHHVYVVKFGDDRLGTFHSLHRAALFAAYKVNAGDVDYAAVLDERDRQLYEYGDLINFSPSYSDDASANDNDMIP
jgi:hypothetical protein